MPVEPAGTVEFLCVRAPLTRIIRASTGFPNSFSCLFRMLFLFGYLVLARHVCGQELTREQQCNAIINENFQDSGVCFALLNTARIEEIRTPFDETLSEKEFVAQNDADCREACANNIPNDCPANLAFFHANLLLKKKLDVDRTLVEKDFENFESKCNNASLPGDTLDSENPDVAMALMGMGIGIDATISQKELCKKGSDLFETQGQALCGTPVQRGLLSWEIALIVIGILLILACFVACFAAILFLIFCRGGRPKVDGAVPPVIHETSPPNIQESDTLLKVSSS